MNSVLNSSPQQNSLLPLQAPASSTPTTNPTLRLREVQSMPVLLDFDGGQLTSDAGLLLLREVDHQLGLVEALATVIPDTRDARYTQHSTEELLLQRIGQIINGYEDANDCNTLRHDPIFKMFAGRLPESAAALASQPTMCRFENRVTRKMLYQMALVFVEQFVASYDAPPPIIVLDLDDTEDRVYGDQQLALFNNYYKGRCYMPLHIYEGVSGKLITTILKPGKRARGKLMRSIVKRLIAYLRQQWPDTIFILRGDSHFAYPEVMTWTETQANVHYCYGLTGNAVLNKQVQTPLATARKLYEHTKRTARLYHAFSYQAESWPHARRVVVKVEMSEQGANVRFVVTDMNDARAEVLYRDIYCERGHAELYIKEHKLYLKSDRTSCSDFFANQLRLFLHSAAYVLIHALKSNVLKHTEWAKASIATLRARLFKIGARVRQLKTRIKVELPAAFPLKELLTRSFQKFELLTPVLNT